MSVDIESTPGADTPSPAGVPATSAPETEPAASSVGKVQSASALASGILGDLQDLVGQQFRLTRREIEDEVRGRSVAAGIFGIGVAAYLLAGGMLALSLSHLLHWASSPAGSDPARLPLWVCQAVTAAVLFGVGTVLANLGRERFGAVEPFRDPTEILQETPPWTTPPK